MRRASALCFIVLMVFLGAIVLRQSRSMTTPEGDAGRQTGEAGDLPAKIQDRAPGAVSVELHPAAPAAAAVKASAAILPPVASPLAEIPGREPQFSQTARAGLWSYNGSILQLEREGEFSASIMGRTAKARPGRAAICCLKELGKAQPSPDRPLPLLKLARRSPTR
jgi:hypothetical protein